VYQTQVEIGVSGIRTLAYNRGEYPLGVVQAAGLHSQDSVPEVLGWQKTAPKHESEENENHTSAAAT